MRFMVITKATAESEAGVLPATEDFDTMGTFIQELVDAGVLLDAGGLQSSAKGARIYFDGDKKTVVDGPFTETKELIGGPVTGLVDQTEHDSVMAGELWCRVTGTGWCEHRYSWRGPQATVS